MTISERIFKLMEEREITQMDFSKATGIAQSTISDWKRKKTNPSADKIMIICNVLKVTPYELLQDTVQSVEELDYRVVTKGTKEYDLLNEMESLNKSQKERLLGYIEALKQ
ncbi:Transcriptional regulator, contains XRE-family HTH domain [Lachnospiraceae bacterium A10]|nr:Transcriptional regulator, contains XRE-family HTH domain [Lachnospiraceae bacterium A10]